MCRGGGGKNWLYNWRGKWPLHNCVFGFCELVKKREVMGCVPFVEQGGSRVFV